MARVCLLAFIAGFLLEVHGLPAVIKEENTGAVFVSEQAAHAVLHRQRRYNSGHLEEVLYKANLERECREETCTMEEAREVFEDDEKTLEFWAGYIDGDQCNPPPCQNGGVCQDGVSAYVCWCKPDFGGKNCEIEVSKQCSVNNGGCSQFCKMDADRPVCHCVTGYQLGTDMKTCEPTEQFSCGRLTTSPPPASGPVIRVRSSSGNLERKYDSNGNLREDYYFENITDFYDYYESLSPANDSDLLNTSEGSVGHTRSERSADAVTSSNAETPTEPAWAFPTLVNISEKENVDQRIVGGNDAAPGEIPWQVSLMSHSTAPQRATPFCGGSLLSELWVITAAHCLTQAADAKRSFFVRVGEHDMNVDEGPERDHSVQEQHIFPKYNFKTSPYNHDIALLKLASPVELSVHRRPICLGPRDFTEKLMMGSNNSLVSGWGQMLFRGRESTTLQKLEVPYVDRTLCKGSSLEHVTRLMFCAGFQSEQKDACQGDSGGPHATKYKDTWFLTGIVSWGEDCAKDGKYGIYTRVSRYYKWISQKTGIRVN